MLEVVVFAEGATEESFIKRVVSPALRPHAIFLKPQTLSTSATGRGGAVTIDRLKHHARNTLLARPNAMLSTFLDLYALDTHFPGYAEAGKKRDVHDRVAHLEHALHEAVTAHVGCRPQRFVPHIQPYEFEGLLFADVEALSKTDPNWPIFLPKLRHIRTSFETPEHINDSFETKPSKRLEDLLRPRYEKTRHGPLAAEHITLACMEAECQHFHLWMNKLRALAGQN